MNISPQVREKGFAKFHEVSLGQLDFVTHLELQHGFLPCELYSRYSRVRPTRESVDLKLAASNWA